MVVTANGASPNSRAVPATSIRDAFAQAEPGDTILLTESTYLGTTTIENVSGSPNHPIVLISAAEQPADFAVLDGEGAPENMGKNYGLLFRNCSWINIEKIVFKDCWNSAVRLDNSSYITIRDCHFTTGKWIVHPNGIGSHHVLVENCHAEHPPEVWKGWSWLEIHHGLREYYNGALLHPRKSGGGHVMRDNTLINMFNGFRTRPADIREDGNTEIYGNRMVNIRDNEFEPETWAWNMHYYGNDHHNIHKLYSIDGVKGGNIFIYGNTYTQDLDDWSTIQVSGIFKYKNGPLTYPCYAFNNSYYTSGRVMKYRESTNHHMKHYNNAYHFVRRKNAFRVNKWQPGYEFDYDCQNHGWPKNITENNQEKNGLSHTLPGFRNPQAGDLRLSSDSPCWDRGKPLSVDLLDWEQGFDGSAPDIGAFENGRRVQGPPFRYIPSPEGGYYSEHPRISRHYVRGPYLLLYFSEAIKEQPLSDKFQIYQSGASISIKNLTQISDGFCLLVESEELLNAESLSITFAEDILGINNLSLVGWASTIDVGSKARPSYDLGSVPLPPAWSRPLPEVGVAHLSSRVEGDTLTVEVTLDGPLDTVYKGILSTYSADDVNIDGSYPTYHDQGATYELDISNYAPGDYKYAVYVTSEIYWGSFQVPRR